MLRRPVFAPLAALATSLIVADPATARPPACTCEHLESLQQEYRNAVYLEKFMRQMAEVLKAEELRLQGLKSTSNADPDQNLAIRPTVLALRERYVAQNMKLPFPQVKGYTGPAEVDMPYGSCEQSPADLAAMEAGSPCEAIADATAAHELLHRDLCKAMGAAAYWDRMASVMALEEAERYRAQAANMKSEIGRVLDNSKLRLRGEWEYAVSGPEVKMVYHNAFESEDMVLVSRGGDDWTFSGKGEHSAALQSMKASDLTCSSDSAVRNSFTVLVETDGLTFGLDYSAGNPKFEIKVSCTSPYGGGMGMSLPVEGAGIGSGRLTTSQPLVAGDNPVPNDWVEPIRAMMEGGGLRLTGEPKTVLSLTCDAH